MYSVDEFTNKRTIKLPKLDIHREGNSTIIRNFSEITAAMNREPNQILTFLCPELGTQAKMDGKRAIFRCQLDKTDIEQKLEQYIEKFIKCESCELPDTRLIKKKKSMVLKCDACGYIKEVKMKNGKKKK
ncbi:MAG: translation initiation factor IF-2 subunit beta [Candidatus Hermodarchaeota archaeon]